MLVETDVSAAHRLFKKFREQFDTNGKLQTPSLAISIKELWQMLESGLKVDRQTLAGMFAELLEVDCASDDLIPLLTLLRRVPRKLADQFLLIPCGMEEDEPVIAVANTLDEEMQENLRFIFGSHYRLQIAHPDDIELAIAKGYEDLKLPKQKQKKTERNIEDEVIPKLARQLLKHAISKKVSDLHLQPFAGGAVVRGRVDGLLQRLVIIPESVARALIRYFKAHSGMDPTYSQAPQDGRMLLDLDENEYDLRLSTLPVTGRMEKLVIRFLNRQSVYNLSAIGFSLDEIHTINRLAASPSGVILVCGPTGSGKTTTLYSILSNLNSEDTSIMTVENPVEYTMQGLSQTEINDKAGMTFPRALRAILRQDPDVLLIGEIRDKETAEIAMQSALTGHLVFSTLHTNDSLGAIPRLLDLGVNPIIIAEALAGIMSQRLLRKLCKNCKVPLEHEGEHDPAAIAFGKASRSHQPFAPKGCEACNFSGYAGRTVIAELLEIEPAQRNLLLGGEKDITVFRQTMQGTFNSLSMSASRLIISGETTAAEAYSVLGKQFWLDIAFGYGNEVPDLSNLGRGKNGADNTTAILLAGDIDTVSTELAEALKSAWFSVSYTNNSIEAEEILRKQDNFAMVILDLKPGYSDTEVCERVADFRQHLAWSRLPALIRIPTDSPHYETVLRANGATSRFINLGVDAQEATILIQDAINQNKDFKWGILPYTQGANA